MKQAIWAIFFHKISTDLNPQHGLCPLGDDSWCGYNRSKLKGLITKLKVLDLLNIQPGFYTCRALQEADYARIRKAEKAISRRTKEARIKNRQLKCRQEDDLSNQKLWFWSPNHGGLWEAGVKAFKFHLKRVVGNAHLTLEEFITILCEIEAVLNSRPLTPLTSNFDDFETLTPGHFLVGRPLTSIVEPQITNINENQLSRWEREPIRGRRFSTREDIVNAVSQQVTRFTQGAANAEAGGIQRLLDRWQRVVIAAGDYIEGL
ncbi:integrase catalytic domain-containing protein [Trichonephila clavipes]|nr:integrase catalytic domain-containing protein [Trichonephila clavipes]